MRKKVQNEPKKGAPAYMSTYGDMMTLLMTFFVLLFSMSTVDTAKFKAFIESYSGSAGILDGGEVILNSDGMLGNGVKQFPNTPLVAQTQQYLKESRELQGIQKEIEDFIYSEALESKVGVEQKGDAIILRFADVLLFDSGKAVLKEEATEVLELVGRELEAYIQNGYKVKLEGHTDNVPIKTLQFPSNWELSASRAIAVATFFIQELDFIPNAVSAEGYGEYMPIADNLTDVGRAMNRRVEIKITKAH